MLLYHASTVKIKDFYVPLGGIHVGGRFSALEAALRKVRSSDDPNVSQVYVHLLEVDVGRSMDIEDMGGCDAWRCSMYIAQRDGFDSLEYKNNFEPDVTTSYVLWEPNRIKVLKCYVLSQDEAEDVLNEFYEAYNIY